MQSTQNAVISSTQNAVISSTVQSSQWAVSGTNEDCMGDRTAHVSDVTTSWMTGMFRQVL